MRTNYRINSDLRFQMLSEDQSQELFEGVLQIVEYNELEVQHEEAGAILTEAGAILTEAGAVDAEIAKPIGADGYGSNSPSAAELASQSVRQA